MQKDPMKEWVLRDELLAAFHRWPVIVLFALVGSLLGLAFAYLWPASYRANVELSVELNPYRVLDDQYVPEFAAADFRNIDDYKHWQMLQLSILVLSDPYMLETITRLREKDQVWSSVSPQELRDMLTANWRNAGQWNLTANGRSSQQAVEAAETWSEVVIDLTQDSIASSRDLFRLEIMLRSLNSKLIDLQLLRSALEGIQVDLAEIQARLLALPENEVLSTVDRMEIFTVAHLISDLLPGVNSLLSSFPPAGAPVSDYILWLEGLIAILEREMDSIEIRITEIQDEITQVNSEWEAGLSNAKGLSATLNIANPKQNHTQVEEIRSYSLAALIGGLLGLLTWLMVFLVRVTRKGYQ